MTSNLLITCTALFFCITTSQQFSQAAPLLPVLIYEKRLPRGEEITVLKGRMPATPKVLKFMTELKAKSSEDVKSSITLPDYSEAYTYNVKMNGQPQKTVWFQRIDHFPGQELGKIKVLDATYEGDKFVVALKYIDPPITCAAVIDTKLKAQKVAILSNALTIDSDAHGIYAKSATINGSILAGTLSVDVAILGHSHERFDWKGGKWVKRDTSEAVLPVPPPTINPPTAEAKDTMVSPAPSAQP